MPVISKFEISSGDDSVDRATALASQRAAVENVKTARIEHDAYQVKLIVAKEKQATQRALSDAADGRARESAGELARARETKSDSVLREELAAAADKVTRARAVWEQAEKQLSDADPEVAQLTFENARDGHKAIRDELDKLKNSASTLSLELQVLGQQGLGEEVQELDGKLIAAIQHRDRLKREADALKLLYETLVRAEQQAREAFLAPVQTRVQPYLRLLLPETELVLSDDDLGVTALRRNGQEEPFESLSVGAREQVAVLTRLAFADLLRERGTIAPVVLDDALVNTDPNRFKRMVLAIRKASKNLQIIVLTCNEAQWLQEGAPTVRLAECIPTN
jgi:wobble nucleotide-excising tRNase